MDLFEKIKSAIHNSDYLLRPHAISHMLSEGFHERDIVDAVKNGRILELYKEENRCLIVGRFSVTSKIKEYLHVVIDYWSETDDISYLDIITAYIPRRPYWINHFKRGKQR